MYKRIGILALALLLFGCHEVPSGLVMPSSVTPTDETIAKELELLDTTTATPAAIVRAAPELPATAQPIVGQSVNISDVTRIEIPWLGPIIDDWGFTQPLAVGDVDLDTRSELLINLPALDDDLASPTYDPAILTHHMLVKAFEWDGAAYTLEHLLPVEQKSYSYGIAQTNSMALIDWGGNRTLVVGSNWWRTNQYGFLSIVALRDDVTYSFLETVCLGAVYRLDPVEINGNLSLFVSTVTNHNPLHRQRELKACTEQGGVSVQDGLALVQVKREATGFGFTCFEQAGVTLLFNRLPSEQGSLYHIASNWSGDTPALQVRMVQGDDFEPTDILPDYGGKYVVEMATADMDGDNLREVFVLRGLSDYRPKERYNYETIRDIHLDIYQWHTNRYHLVLSYQLPTPWWHLFTGDLDNDGRDEVIFGPGMILDLQEKQYVVDETLVSVVDALNVRLEPDTQFLIADINDDQRNEVVMLSRVWREAIPDDVWLRMVWREWELPPEEAYKASMPETGIYYAYIMEFKEP